MTLELISIILSLAIYSRASNLARGKKLKKIFSSESFLFWQKLLGIYLAIWIAYFLITGNTFYWFMIIGLVMDGLFYLQPTPRTTEKLLMGYIALSVIAVIYSLS
jgi:hypothetical protein